MVYDEIYNQIALKRLSNEEKSHKKPLTVEYLLQNLAMMNN